MSYTPAFEAALDHAMLYEVGGFWKLTPDVIAGKIDTKEQRRAVGYTNSEGDRGGETKFGIAKTANPNLDITNLDWEGAKAVYFKEYWTRGSCDKMSSRLAVLHFDGCMNHGVGKAGRFLQVAVGTTPDGAVGPATLAKAAALDELVVCAKICDRRTQFYRDIVSNDSSQAKWLNGWLRRIEEMRALVLDKNRSFS